MSQLMAYCSAVDRPVPVRPLGEAGDRAPDHASQLVCLEYGVRCSGAFCPRMLWIPDEEDGVQPAALVRLAPGGGEQQPPLPRAS